jgi:branched-chain amino acid transport system substrate-binding protein
MFTVKKRTALQGSFGALALAAALACGGPQAIAQSAPGVTNDTIVIGGIGPVTGPASWVGLGGRDGFMLALDEINAAGIHGRKIKVAWEDDAGTPSGAVAGAKRLVERENVFAIFAAQTSNGAVAIVDYISDNKVPYLQTSAASDKLIVPFQRYIFMGATLPISRISKGVVGLALDHHKAKRPAMLSPADEQGKTFAQFQQKEFEARGVKVLVNAEHAAADTDFTSQLVQIKNANPDILLLASAIPAASIILRQARELGLNIPIIGGTSSTGEALPRAAAAAAEGYQSAWLAPYFPADPSPANQAFLAKYKAKYTTAATGRPNYPDYFGYADAFVLAEALRRAGPNPTREGLVTALESLKGYKGADVASPRSFSATDRVGNSVLFFVQVKSGKYEALNFNASAQ